MKQTRIHTWITLTALLLCSACGNQSSKTATFITPTTQQMAALRWDETIAATTTARVNNGSLISMR